MVSVLICDDAPIVRAGLRLVIESEPGLEVAGEAADGDEAVSACTRLSPDVVLLDIQMPGRNGIDAAHEILRGGTSARILVLTTYDTDEYLYAALRAGASGFLVKDSSPERVVEAIRTVAAGDAQLSPSITRRLLETATFPMPAQDGPLTGLSTTDTRLLVLIARGRTNAEISAETGFSPSTVKSYVSRLFTKIGARDRTHAAVLAYENGVVRPGGH
jgi:DNA-binding NarL/FixJ family response regulator